MAALSLKAVLLLTVACLHLSEGRSRFSLHLMDRLYMPFEYTPIARFEYNKDAAIQARFDEAHDFAYVLGADLINVVDMEDVTHLDFTHHHHENDFTFTDIVLCGNYVVVSADSVANPANGKVFIYRKFNRISQTMPLVNTITAGYNPKSLAITTNCQNIFVAMEGRGYYDGPTFNNPEGGLGFVHFTSGDLTGTPSYKVLDFTEFNADQDEYIAHGVRFVYKTDSTFSQDLEPESVTLNTDQTQAYVALQENNAIATFDISNYNDAKATELYSLGYKKWKDLLMDTSDDGSIKLQKWNIFGMYQPDEIRYFDVDGTGYIISANEGNAKEYGLFYTEAKRGQDFMIDDLVHSSVSSTFRDQLLTNSNLGRLEFTVENGKEADGKFSDFFTFGGRSFSIRRADNVSVIVYDSGDFSERHHESLTPITFNTDPRQGILTVNFTMDTRSDNRGPEPESVAVGVIDEDTLLFIGNERTGTVEVYSVIHEVINPVFHNISTLSPWAKEGNTWHELYEQRHTGDLGIEGLEFVDARHSPNLKPLLLVTGAVSGTLSVFQISKEDEIEDDVLQSKVDGLFTLADKDGNEELSLEEHNTLILEGDLNGDHRVDENEFFLDFRVKIGLLEEKAEFVFNEMDRNNNKFLDLYDTTNLFYYADRDASATVTRDQYGREYKRIFQHNIDLGSKMET